ncbi:MAG: ATP-binding cassette domain-containing protein [Clostridiales bacterium]|nr:ATP-binding cassette domain-containing protein [Clostridiales bacterium]
MSLYCKIQKRLGRFLLDVELDVGDEVLALLGASGCGKSMTLRCIAGIEKPDHGIIVLDDKTLFDSKKRINLPPKQRKTGMLFQDYALFPNMSVLENISISASRASRSDVDALITTFRLEGLENHHPYQLSGGQRQRCALARMLASGPDLIMLDEPFSALDTFLRWQMEQEVAATIKRFGKTVLLVSHNRDEVYRLCSRASVICSGKNEPIRTKHDLFFHPHTYADALLTGCKNIFEATASGRQISIPALCATFTTGTTVSDIEYIGIRAKKILPFFMKSLDARTIDLHYEILSVTESMFSYILLVQPIGGSQPLYWEIEKEKYPEIRQHKSILSIPVKEIMLLREARE